MKIANAEELVKVDFTPPKTGWMDTKADFRKGTYSYAAPARALEYVGSPNPRNWSPADEDWKLPDDWQKIIFEGMRERLAKYRTFRIFMDICVRCGACADKCHFYIGSGDPKNMPVLRGELIRSVYKNDFTKFGKIFGKMAGARKMTLDVLKEWFYYFYQCTECRRCSVFCPYGIDTAEITMMGRELLNLLGLNIGWVMEPVMHCHRTGNHLGMEPHTFQDNLDFIMDELTEATGLKIKPSVNRKGAEVLFITPSADFFADPHLYTLMGYCMLFDHIGLDYTFSAYVAEGGNFGLFSSHETMKKLNAKMYIEAKRLGVKWILGGECGHMWRVINQYMDTHNGPADFMEVPKSPITGTVFENAKSTKMTHICEFTSDLIRHDKLKFDKSRNDGFRVTFHDSCNPARAMGLFDEPRHVIKTFCNNFFEMPPATGTTSTRSPASARSTGRSCRRSATTGRPAWGCPASTSTWATRS
jgi:Fe-S oxidoreductase